jgi:hypothetical protein
MDTSFGAYLNQKVVQPTKKVAKKVLSNPYAVGVPVIGPAALAYQIKQPIAKSYNDFVLTEQRKKDAKEAQTANKTQENAPKAPTKPAGQSLGAAVGAAGTKVATSTNQGTSEKKEKSAEQKYQDDLRKQIENAYQSQVGFLSQQEQNLQSQLPDYLSSIGSPFEQQRPLLEQQLSEQQAQGLTEQERLRGLEQQSLAQIRRGGEEQSLRAVQQFGGVGGSSAAQAAGELIGREQLRQQGATRTQTVQGIQGVNDQLRAIQSEFNANVSKLQLQKEQALSQARLNFQQQLDSIRKEKALAGVTKAQMTIDALGNFATRRREIENQVTTQQNNLQTLRETAALNAQNIVLQGQVAQQAGASTPIKFSTFTNSAEAGKVLQGILQQTGNNPQLLANYGLRFAGQSPEGSDLYSTSEGVVINTAGQRYQ